MTFKPLLLTLLLLILSFPLALPLQAKEPLKIVLLWGDSLSAGYGVPMDKRWATLLEKRLKGTGYTLVNGSISGETTRGGAARLPAAIERHQPTILILELGGNDGLRGLKLQEIKANLHTMLTLATDKNVSVLLLGMKIPPNYGPQYTQGFEEVFSSLSETFNTLLVPFFLEGIASRYELMQIDGIHPNAAAQEKMLANVWPTFKTLMEDSSTISQDVSLPLLK